MKNIFVIIGSASANSTNEMLVNIFAKETRDLFNLTVYKDLKLLPHFDPELAINKPPPEIVKFRKEVLNADGIIICTPEYVFSIPSGLKNALEWCVATTVFSDKPTGLITASASGEKGHEELRLIMKTVMAKFTEQTTWLIQGVKGKISDTGEINDDKTAGQLKKFVSAFNELVNER